MEMGAKKQKRTGLTGAAASLLGVGASNAAATAVADTADASRKRQREDGGSPGSNSKAGSPLAADGKRAKRSVSPMPGDNNYGLPSGTASGLQTISESEVREALQESGGSMKVSLRDPHFSRNAGPNHRSKPRFLPKTDS